MKAIDVAKHYNQKVYIVCRRLNLNFWLVQYVNLDVCSDDDRLRREETIYTFC